MMPIQSLKPKKDPSIFQQACKILKWYSKRSFQNSYKILLSLKRYQFNLKIESIILIDNKTVLNFVNKRWNLRMRMLSLLSVNTSYRLCHGTICTVVIRTHIILKFTCLRTTWEKLGANVNTSLVVVKYFNKDSCSHYHVMTCSNH